MAVFGIENPAPVAAIALAAVVGYAAYTGSVVSSLGVDGIKQRKEHVQSLQDSLNLLTAQIDTAKQQLALGTTEDLRRRLEGYRVSLELMRRLVPERNEVPNLMDDISTRARIRGVALSQMNPLGVEQGPIPFNTHKYQLAVLGHYDQIGEFLADVASLPRIMVPFDLTLRPAPITAAKALGDSSGAMLEAKFQIRTYVKTLNPEEQASGT
ncbi:MAG: type 4a pilus biogenesis protein PilO [Gemmatimonadales bacterium]